MALAQFIILYIEMVGILVGLKLQHQIVIQIVMELFLILPINKINVGKAFSSTFIFKTMAKYELI